LRGAKALRFCSMKIVPETIALFGVKSRLRNEYAAATYVGNLYCGPMNARGLCTEDCNKCKASILRGFRFTDGARSPIALLTYNLRRELAVQQELAHVHVAPLVRKSIFVPVSETNPFIALANQIRESHEETNR
jgi:hypothetical protein